jgi:hypothetical protein
VGPRSPDRPEPEILVIDMLAVGERLEADEGVSKAVTEP